MEQDVAAQIWHKIWADKPNGLSDEEIQHGLSDEEIQQQYAEFVAGGNRAPASQSCHRITIITGEVCAD